MSDQSNILPWKDTDEAFVKKISVIIEETLIQARNEPQEEWDFVPVSRRADELASVIFYAFENQRRREA
ncbi:MULTISPECIES: hypothetical protein [unclassified Ensifer]|uniref:hypothetical protein n=1 Tax=unclassified Ensifer TaxID=2633371 RepID=UPI000813681D|nr:MULTISPECIES: hypothetical protein [unclassified Ensifer]OCP17030.1 hypothetical protein BC360_12395 [Ensifer sp. LC163]OCP24141.1 hypothetical protein BC363_23180 [Ensifer sp. LC384]OCP25626.1 hypothetical protein BC361_17515 [Ensifer sp. LC54]